MSEKARVSMQAISEGLNALAAMASASEPQAAWVKTLSQMEQALVSIERDASTDATFKATPDQLTKLREIQPVLTQWIMTGERPASLAVTAADLLRRFGLDVDAPSSAPPRRDVRRARPEGSPLRRWQPVWSVVILATVLGLLVLFAFLVSRRIFVPF